MKVLSKIVFTKMILKWGRAYHMTYLYILYFLLVSATFAPKISVLGISRNVNQSSQICCERICKKKNWICNWIEIYFALAGQLHRRSRTRYGRYWSTSRTGGCLTLYIELYWVVCMCVCGLVCFPPLDQSSLTLRNQTVCQRWKGNYCIRSLLELI